MYTAQYSTSIMLPHTLCVSKDTMKTWRFMYWLIRLSWPSLTLGINFHEVLPGERKFDLLTTLLWYWNLQLLYRWLVFILQIDSIMSTRLHHENDTSMRLKFEFLIHLIGCHRTNCLIMLCFTLCLPYSAIFMILILKSHAEAFLSKGQ